MLVLTRKNRESVVIARPEDLGIVLEITILDIEGGRVRLGFQADTKLPIHRREVWDRICNGESPNGDVSARSREYPVGQPARDAIGGDGAIRNGSHPNGPVGDGPIRDGSALAGQAAGFGPPLQAAVRQAAMKAAALRAATTVDGG